MSTIFDKLAAVRRSFPSDIAAIEIEEERVRRLLERKEYAALPESRMLLSMCREQIVQARKMLSAKRDLSPEERDGLWHIIDSRRWVVEQLGQNFDAELQQIERELDAELSR